MVSWAGGATREAERTATGHTGSLRFPTQGENQHPHERKRAPRGKSPKPRRAIRLQRRPPQGCGCLSTPSASFSQCDCKQDAHRPAQGRGDHQPAQSGWRDEEAAARADGIPLERGRDTRPVAGGEHAGDDAEQQRGQNQQQLAKRNAAGGNALGLDGSRISCRPLGERWRRAIVITHEHDDNRAEPQRPRACGANIACSRPRWLFRRTDGARGFDGHHTCRLRRGGAEQQSQQEARLPPPPARSHRSRRARRRARIPAAGSSIGERRSR